MTILLIHIHTLLRGQIHNHLLVCGIRVSF